MQPVLINGFLYWYDGNILYTEDKKTEVPKRSLTANEQTQMYNCLHYDQHKEHVQEYLKKHNIKP